MNVYIAELAQIILNTRDLCGNEARAIRAYLAENGLTGAFADTLTSQARLRANELWLAAHHASEFR